MKKILLIITLMLITLSVWAQKTVWLEDYKQALKISSEKKIPILIDFTGSDWCVWCKRLDKEVFTQPEFAKYASKNLVLLKIDFPDKNNQSEEVKKFNKELAAKYNIEGFPTIVLINSNGVEINRTGYQEGGPVKYIKHLQKLLKKK